MCACAGRDAPDQGLRRADHHAPRRHISAAAHVRAMRATRPGNGNTKSRPNCCYEFRKRGADGAAYTSIVAGGANACVLHYVGNNTLLKDGDLLLIDAGCEAGRLRRRHHAHLSGQRQIQRGAKGRVRNRTGRASGRHRRRAPGRHWNSRMTPPCASSRRGMIDLKLCTAKCGRRDRKRRLQTLLHAPHRPLAGPGRARRRRLQARRTTGATCSPAWR